MSKTGKRIHQDKYLKARRLVRGFKKAHVVRLMQDRNVVGVAFGRRTAHGEITDDPAIVVYVLNKTPARFVPPSRLLPRKVFIGGDCVELDIVQTGPLYPQAFTARERPAPAGASIGHPNITAGTLGAVVVDNIDNTDCILSNNHVMADENAASIGDAIIQQGIFDGGSSPADTIATLKRFVTINATGNLVDGAIAQIIGALGTNVVDRVKDNLIPTANADHPAVGLLFAGSCSMTIMNPIERVLAALNIRFPGGPNATIDADIGMNVEKVGRTTEYTTSTVKEIDATVSIGYEFGTATFDNQITTAWMSDGGDSGSVVYRGGNGGDTSNCGCGTSSAAEVVLQTTLERERFMADEIRDKFLRHTKIGRWAIDLFFRNEDQLLARFRRTKIEADDKEYARKLYDKYRDLVRQAFIDGENSSQTVTAQHVRDADTALKRGAKYLETDEYEAANKLAAIAEKRTLGKNPREILAMLNDEKLFEQIKDLVSQVSTIKTEDCDCSL